MRTSQLGPAGPQERAPFRRLASRIYAADFWVGLLVSFPARTLCVLKPVPLLRVSLVHTWVCAKFWWGLSGLSLSRRNACTKTGALYNGAALYARGRVQNSGGAFKAFPCVCSNARTKTGAPFCGVSLYAHGRVQNFEDPRPRLRAGRGESGSVIPAACESRLWRATTLRPTSEP